MGVPFRRAAAVLFGCTIFALAGCRASLPLPSEQTPGVVSPASLDVARLAQAEAGSRIRWALPVREMTPWTVAGVRASACGPAG